MSSIKSLFTLNGATFVTSIISLLTLNELRRQRNLTNTPKLHIISPKNMLISVKNQKYQFIERILPTEWESNDIEIKKISSGFPPFYSIPLKIINTGSSPALNIVVTWDYDHETIRNIIKQFNELGLEVKCKLPEKQRDYAFDLVFEKQGEEFSYLMPLVPERFDYVFPFSNLNSETKLLIPFVFTIIEILRLSILSLSEYNIDIREALSLTLFAEVAYYDNTNILHKENYSIEFKDGALGWEYIDNGMDKRNRQFKNAFFSIETQKITKQTLIQRVI